MDALAGLHDIPWATLDHCFGASDDIPDLLRQTAAGSAQALEELGEYLVHQGTLYEATPHLVTFLARIAASGAVAGEILSLLGIAASYDDADQDPGVRGKTRAALAGELTALIPLLAHPSDEVRASAAWALPQSLAADRLVPPLLVRWDQETDPQITASVLRGLSFLDPAGAVAPATGALAGRDNAIRLIAAWACAAGGMPWSAELREAALAWTAGGTPMEHFPWSSRSGHPFSDLAEALAARGDPAAAADLVAAALTGPVAPGTRKQAVLAAAHLATISRQATPELIGPLTSVVAGDDPEASKYAILQLEELDALAQAADELALVADAEGPSRHADRALACLVQLGDPRSLPLLTRDLRHRPYALDALRDAAQKAVLPFSEALLDEIRACLREQFFGPRSTPFLIGLIGSWGPAAAAAIPDLLQILPRHGYSVGCALADIAGATPEAISLLRQAAACPASLNAATRLRTLTDDEEPLLAAVESSLTEASHDMWFAAQAARTLTPARRLIPALTAALDATARADRPDGATRLELALARWHHSGDPATVVEVIAGELRADATDPGPRSAGAAEAAADIGPAARPLIPAILPLLDSPEACPAAVRALLRIDPRNHGGVSLGALAERLLLPLGQVWSGVQLSAVEMLGEIGLPQLPTPVVDRLRELVTQDGRIVNGGHVQAFIRDDDQLRAAILGLVGDVAAAGGLAGALSSACGSRDRAGLPGPGWRPRAGGRGRGGPARAAPGPSADRAVREPEHSPGRADLAG